MLAPNDNSRHARMTPGKQSSGVGGARAGSFWRRGSAGLLALFFWSAAAQAQDSLISSLAGEDAAAAAKQATANQSYNLKMGALKLRFTASLAVEADDNVDLTPNNRRADLSARPEVDMTAFWPVTDKNALTLTLGMGYAKYLRTPSLNHYFLTPNSLLSFNIYAGDFLINLHNQFTYQQEAYQTTEISGNGNYGYFQNTTGVTVTWDLNNFIISLGLDHDIYSVSDSSFAYQNHSSEILSSRIGFKINPTTQVGLELGAGTTAYDTRPSYMSQTNYPGFNPTNNFGQIITNVFIVTGTNIFQVPTGNFLSDQKYVNAGPFLRLGLSQYMQIRLSAGYAIYFQDINTAYGNAGNSAAFYTEFKLDHLVNSQLQYTLTAGHQIRQGLLSDTLDVYYVQLQPTWNLLHKVSLATPVAFETVKGSATSGDSYTDYSLGLQASYLLTKKLNVAGTYTYRVKNSDVAAYSYFQNQLVLNLQYSF